MASVIVIGAGASGFLAGVLATSLGGTLKQLVVGIEYWVFGLLMLLPDRSVEQSSWVCRYVCQCYWQTWCVAFETLRRRFMRHCTLWHVLLT